MAELGGDAAASAESALVVSPAKSRDDSVGKLVGSSGRPDLAPDEFCKLREEQARLKKESKKVAAEVKKRQRAKARIVKKVRNLNTADIVHVLEQRAVFKAAQSARKAAAKVAAEDEAEPPPDPEEPES